MRARISWLLSASLLLGTTATAAQTLPCSSVSAEVREYVKQRGACREAKPAARPRASTRAASKAADTQPSTPQPPVAPQAAAPAAVAPPDSTADPQATDGPEAGVAGTDAVAAPATAAAAASTQTPATDIDPAPPTASQASLPDASVPPAASAQPSTAFPASIALIFAAGVALGLLFGALSMRQWLLRRQHAVASLPAPSLAQGIPPIAQRPAASAARGTLHERGAEEIRFAAWFVPLETTIVLAPRAGAASIEHSRGHHA